MKDPGKDFEKRFRRRLEERHGCFLVRLRDSHAPLFDKERNPIVSSARFATPNPYDILILKPAAIAGTWYVYAAECKTTIGSRFTLSMLNKPQRDGLSAMPPGIPALVVVEMRDCNRCFFLPIQTILRWEETRKKSMNLADLKLYAVELPYNTQGRERVAYYDMTALLDGDEPPKGLAGLSAEPRRTP
jgi:penicillin-binding protein-related factor A (putative recombinase)